MNEAKHTPGPWEVVESDTIEIYAGDEPICACGCGDGIMPDANLIAASPEFWTACVLGPGFSTDGATLLEQAAHELRLHGPHLHVLADELERKAQLERAAIAKARGEVM